MKRSGPKAALPLRVLRKAGVNPILPQPADSRSEAVYQKKVVEMVRNSPQVQRIRQLQAMADSYAARQQPAVQAKGQAPVQRKIEFHDNLLGAGKKTVTNGGTGSVDQIGADIMAAQEGIAAVSDLRVIVGYHGDDTGRFAGAFNSDELAEVGGLASRFPNIKRPLDIRDAEVDAEEIIARIKEGNVFFTWCYSDRRVGNIVASLERAKAEAPALSGTEEKKDPAV